MGAVFSIAIAEAKVYSREFKRRVQEHVRKVFKAAGVQGFPLNPARREHFQFLVRQMVLEVQDALTLKNNAQDWYDLKMRVTRAIAATMHPELATDDRAWFAYTYILATTSNGLEVADQFALTDDVYTRYKRSGGVDGAGLMPTDAGRGTAAPTINKHLERYNDMVARMGLDGFRDFMLAKTTVAQLRTLGYKLSGFTNEEEVYGAAILGPKIGNGFFMNLNGVFDELTADRWFVRTWQRWTGRLLFPRPDLLDGSRERLRHALTAIAKDRDAWFAWSNFVGYLPESGFRALSNKELHAIARRIAGVATEKAIRDGLMNVTDEGRELRLAANLVENHLAAERETPKNPTERAYMKAVAAETLARLHKLGYNALTTADIQALLWFPEKRLYEAGAAKEELPRE